MEDNVMGNEGRCPLCRKVRRLSDDHIFSQFLGGKATTRTCTKCNNGFGGDFEGRCSNTLAPFIIFLDHAGIPAPPNTVWKKAFERSSDAGTMHYDAKPGRKGHPSRIYYERQGHSQHWIGPNLEAIRKIANANDKVRSGGKLIEERNEIEMPLDGLKYPIKIDEDLRRLSLKMLVCLAASFNEDTTLVGEGALAFLAGQAEDAFIMPISYSNNAANLALEEPGIVLMIDANREIGVLGAVSWFGYPTIHAVLNNKYEGDDIGLLGILNLRSQTELFNYGLPAGLRKHPRQGPAILYGFDQIQAMRRMDRLLSRCLGASAPRLTPAPIIQKLILFRPLR